MAIKVLYMPAPEAFGYTASQMIEYGQQYTKMHEEEILELKNQLAEVEYEVQIFREIAKRGLDVNLTAQDKQKWNNFHTELMIRFQELREQPKRPDSGHWTFD